MALWNYLPRLPDPPALCRSPGCLLEGLRVLEPLQALHRGTVRGKLLGDLRRGGGGRSWKGSRRRARVTRCAGWGVCLRRAQPVRVAPSIAAQKQADPSGDRTMRDGKPARGRGTVPCSCGFAQQCDIVLRELSSRMLFFFAEWWHRAMPNLRGPRNHTGVSALVERIRIREDRAPPSGAGGTRPGFRIHRRGHGAGCVHTGPGHADTPSSPRRCQVSASAGRVVRVIGTLRGL